MINRVPMTQIEVPDYDHGLRGKMIRAEKSHTPGLAFCTIVYGLSLVDDVADTPFSSAANGYPDAPLVLDEDTRVELPWRPGVDAVIADLDCGLSPRTVLTTLLRRYADLDLTPVLGFEFEVWLYRDDRTPLGRTENAYSLTRCAEADALFGEFVFRMQQIGVEIEMVHSELGPGLFEFTLSPARALQACDNAARARQYLRDLCAEQGLHASFMAKPYPDKSGAGGHVHSSLMRDGVNVLAAGPASLSPHGSHYLAGLLATMSELTLLFNPYVNSYKRIDPAMFTPHRSDWGHDDRGTACRVILGDLPSSRIEHRRPGADASPYLSAVALLAGGLRGLTEKLDLPEPEPLPGDLGTALERFESASWLRGALGEDFCVSYVATRHAELQRYRTWLKTTVTDWELTRHREHH